MAAILLGAANVAQSANIPILNPSFEADVLNCTAGASCVLQNQVPSGWTESTTAPAGAPSGFSGGGFYGVYKPGPVQYPAGVPDGVNVAYMQTGVYSVSLTQTLTSVLQANDTYTLTFYVGQRADASTLNPALGCSGFNASLMAGGIVLNSLFLVDASVSCGVVKMGAFTQLSFTYFSGFNPPGLGSPLQIVLTANGSGSAAQLSEIDFDEITLTDTANGVSQPYYFSQLAFGGGFQTTLTYINYSPQTVICTTNFYSDSGQPLSVPFSPDTVGTVSSRTDFLQAGQIIHDQSVADLTAPVTEGWAQATCNGQIQASMLYRFYQLETPPGSEVAVGEASVNAELTPASKFVTFAQTATGVAYANPSPTQSATITLTVIGAPAAGASATTLGSQVVTLGPLAHGSANLGPLLGLQSFTGFVEITSTIPIISVSLNAEAFPVFSSLPPGDLPNSATLVP